MLEFVDRWVWDSWYVERGAEKHIFFLQAPKSLANPDLRHQAATVGHAVSADYRNWRVLPDALTPGAAGSWDDLAIWTGSITRSSESGPWYFFYTGISRRNRTRIQNIGLATSDDLVAWTRVGDLPVVLPDPRWYETGPSDVWHERTWRDPWVYRDPDGDGWHMLITARAADGRPADRGVIGHAWSSDLLRWEMRAPLSKPAGFGHLEVPQLVDANGSEFILFCCTAGRLGSRPAQGGSIFAARAKEPGGPFDIAGAVGLESGPLYAGRIVSTDQGPALMAFEDRSPNFVGRICDPQPLEFHDGLPRLRRPVT